MRLRLVREREIMMKMALLKLLVTIHAWWVAGAVYEFKIVPRAVLKRYMVSRVWDAAHHVIEGKNGGEMLIARTSVWFPKALWKEWALVYRRKPRRHTWNRQ